jgi:hypothetical protein
MSGWGGHIAPAACAVFAILIRPGATHAETSAADSAAAAALFAEALRLLGEGRVTDACPKLEESQKLDPAAGTGLNLGDCFERMGRTASAYGAFDEAGALARRAGDAPRAQEAARRRGQLEPKLARILVTVPAASRIAGLIVLRNGRPLGAGQWDMAVPVDPGRHRIEAKAPGRRPWKVTVQVDPAPGTLRLTIPELPADETASASPNGRPGQRIAAIVVGSAGIAALATGGGFAIAAAVKKDESLKHCLPGDPNRCYAKGIVLRNESLTYADTSTVLASVGGVAFLTGGLLLLTAGSSRSPERRARVWALPFVSPQAVGGVAGTTW